MQLLYDPSHAHRAGDGPRHPDAARHGSGERASIFGAVLAEVHRRFAARCAGVDGHEGGGPEGAGRPCCRGVRSWNQRSQRGATPERGPRAGLSMPYTVKEEAVTARKGVAVQRHGPLVRGHERAVHPVHGHRCGHDRADAAADGMWKRLQAAPISRFTVIAQPRRERGHHRDDHHGGGVRLRAVVFGVRIEGSFAGFVGVCAAFAMMTASFGLLIAMLGKTPEGTRGISILVTLVLVMLGGSWVPAFLFPQWLQKATLRGADALGGGRAGRDDLARPGLRRGPAADRRAARVCGAVRGGRDLAVPVGN